MGTKPALVERRWVQLCATGAVAFVLGVGAGGEPATAEPDLAPGLSIAEQDEVQQALEESQSENESLAREVERAEADAASALEDAVDDAVTQVREEAAVAQRRAVQAAKAVVRQRSAARQEAAVAAAVASAEASATAGGGGGGGGSTDPQFSYCYEANDAGYGNYVRGVDPEYDWYDDRDGDGSVCEF